MKKVISFLTLFSSTSTLLCCALPALFVALGSGAVFASLVVKVPALIYLSEHKIALFIFAGVMLAVSGVMQFRSRDLSCPVDPALAEACKETRSWSKPIWFISVGVYSIGAFFAFIAPLIL